MSDTGPALPAWLFLDVGWTLVDETRAHLLRFEAALAAAPGAGGLIARDLYARYEQAVVDGAADPYVTALESIGLTAADRRRFPFDHAATRLYRDASPALRALHGAVRLGVLANQSAGLEERLARWGVRPLFDLVFESEAAGARKPDPRFFAMAAERAGCAPDRIVMAGDRLDNDIAPAHRAGWGTVWVRRGLHARCEPRTDEERPGRTVTNLTKLAALFVPPERLRLAEQLDNDGAIVAWPEKEGDKRLVLEYLATRFSPGRDYAEREVNDLIVAHHRFNDYALLRREMIDRRLLTRDDAGRRYRRPG